MKKVLIWDDFPLINNGGPSGYLYNIHEYIKQQPVEHITFLSDLLAQQRINIHIREEGDNKIPIVGRVLVHFKLIFKYSWGIFRNKTHIVLPLEILNEYDYIHFHNNPHVSQFKARYPNYSGKLILTSHCPCTWTDEILPRLPKYMSIFRKQIFCQECRNFRITDYIMFPCKEAREPYEKYNEIERIFTSKEMAFFYVTSSITDVKINKEIMQSYASIGIPADAFVITYFGRHNYIKGYDILKTVGEKLLDRYPNLYFLCAGRGEIQPLNHERWIELGFVNNTAELLEQSDLYILPNRETYFDLVLLEVFRSCTYVIISDTGGNRYFKQYLDEERIGISFFDIKNIDSLLEQVSRCIEAKASNLERYRMYGKANRKIFEDSFTIDRYVKNYVEAIDNLH